MVPWDPRAAGATVDPQEVRQRMECLWQGLQQLPTRQRAALLLTQRDAEGMGLWEWIPALGLASLQQIAEGLEMTLPQFLELMPQLPVADSWLEKRYGLTRQQAITLRQGARERLLRNVRPQYATTDQLAARGSNRGDGARPPANRSGAIS